MRASWQSRAKIKRITFLGHFGAGNLGNECTLQATIERTLQRWPQASLQCACTNPEDVESRHNIAAVGWKPRPAPLLDSGRTGAVGGWRGLAAPLLRIPRRILREFVHIVTCFRILDRNDMLIVCGTGVVCDFLTGPSGWPYDLFKWSALTVLRGGRILFLGVGVGPINHPVSRWLIRRALGIASYRSYRDQASKQYLETIGFRTDRDIVCPDVAFGLSGDLFRLGGDRVGEKPVIGLGLKGYAGTSGTNTYQDYLDVMVSFVCWLCGHGYDVRLVIGDIPHDTQVTEDVIDALKGRIADEGQVIAEPALTVEELLRQLKATDLVISPRFHNLVLASALNKPIMALSDHPKLDSLMLGFGLSEYRLPLATVDLDALTELFERLWNDAERVKACIRDKTEKYREALDEQYASAFAKAERIDYGTIVGVSRVPGS
jgi:polysaccharide pyruvyl transferase WcaK-like protein